jgi:ethanolamine utilization protein EutN
MILGNVVGTVVSTRRADSLDAPRHLLVAPCDQRGAPKQTALIALDLIGARRGDVVLVCQGSPCRQTAATENQPLDAVIAAIVDLIDQGDEVVYRIRAIEREGVRV